MMGLLITTAIMVVVVAKLAASDKSKPWAGLKSELFDKPKPPRNNKNYPPPATY